MYILKYVSKDQQAEVVTDRFREMSLAFKEEAIPQLTEITLFDEDEVIATGLDDIQKHLDELKGELHSWYYCDC